jgi:hypothetical protein
LKKFNKDIILIILIYFSKKINILALGTSRAHLPLGLSQKYIYVHSEYNIYIIYISILVDIFIILLISINTAKKYVYCQNYHYILFFRNILNTNTKNGIIDAKNDINLINKTNENVQFNENIISIVYVM